MTREDKLRRFAMRNFGQTELEKIDNLLKKNPGKIGIRLAIARLYGALDSLEYTESEYQEDIRTKPLTTTLMERFRTRNNSKQRKPA